MSKWQHSNEGEDHQGKVKDRDKRRNKQRVHQYDGGDVETILASLKEVEEDLRQG